MRRLTATTRSSERRAGRYRPRRIGVVTLEVIIVLPLLLFEFIAIFEFGVLAIVGTAASQAVVDGAHEGSLLFPSSLPFDLDGNPDPTTNDDIADAIALHMNRSLAIVGIEIQQTGSANDNLKLSNAYVKIVRGNVVAQRGNTSIAAKCIQTGQASAANEVIVTLCFALVSSPPAGHPVPDWLSMFGFSFSNNYFNATSRFLLQ